MTSFETPGEVRLRVELEGGDVSVETWDEARVEVELVPLRDNDVTRQAIAEARVEMVPRGGVHEVVVSLKRRGGLSFGRGPKIAVQVRCPTGSGLDLRASSADLRARGTLGAVEVKTASGDVSLEALERLRVDTASGDIHVEDVQGTVEIRTASGDATLRSSGGPLSANLVSGDLEVGDAAAGVDVKTVSGDVEIRAVGGGGIRVQSVSGDVRLAVKPGQRLYVDASSVSGTMTSELGLEDTPAPTGEGAVHDLRVRTISGDLHIGRVAA